MKFEQWDNFVREHTRNFADIDCMTPIPSLQVFCYVAICRGFPHDPRDTLPAKLIEFVSESAPTALPVLLEARRKALIIFRSSLPSATSKTCHARRMMADGARMSVFCKRRMPYVPDQFGKKENVLCGHYKLSNMRLVYTCRHCCLNSHSFEMCSRFYAIEEAKVYRHITPAGSKRNLPDSDQEDED